MTRQELLNKRLAMYLRAEEAIVAGAQNYQIGDRLLTRANLAEIDRMIEYLLEKGATVEGMEQRKIRQVARVIYYDN